MLKPSPGLIVAGTEMPLILASATEKTEAAAMAAVEKRILMNVLS